MVIGTVRLCFDVRVHGFVALRDFATVYYAAFFFLGQEAGRERAGRRFLYRVLLLSCALILPLSTLDSRYPDFFLEKLTFHGIPLIFYKGDLLGTFMAVGAVLFFLRYEAGGSRWNVAMSLLLGVGVLATNNRASMLGLLVATAWLQTAGRWRFAAAQVGAGVMAALIILMVASAMNIPWQRTPVYGLYERTLSLIDVGGERTYRSEESANKGDNNVFRKVWWQAVFDETVEYNAYVGLGFGHNLADRFVRTYYPDSPDEFSTRSPHNILLTIFARMGAIGLAMFLVVLGLIARRTWLAVRIGPREGALWCSAWVIFATACLGVVLEGPMGAVVFWTILGLANAEVHSDDSPEAVGAADEVLLPDVPPDEVPATL
jgi:O-antigen ligase